MKKKLFIIAGVILVLILSASVYVYRLYFSPKGIELNKLEYPITGIDISNHNGEIDFKKLINNFPDTLDFIYMKASEGLSHVDKAFETNYTNAKKYNIPLGFYHFFRFDAKGKEQATHFISVIKDKKNELPIVLDIEEWGNFSDNKTDDVVKEISHFIYEIYYKLKKPVMLYSNKDGYDKYVKGKFNNNDIWICTFRKQPDFVPKWIFWQHSHKGKVKGAEGWIDINTFNGTRSEWNNYLKKISYFN